MMVKKKKVHIGKLSFNFCITVKVTNSQYMVNNKLLSTMSSREINNKLPPQIDVKLYIWKVFVKLLILLETKTWDFK